MILNVALCCEIPRREGAGVHILVSMMQACPILGRGPPLQMQNIK